MFEYVLTLIPFALVTTVTLLKRRRYLKIVSVSSLICLVFGVLWDYSILVLWNIWSFNPDRTLPLWIWGLPVEEWLFAVVVGSAITCVTLLLAEHMKVLKYG